MRKFAFDLTFHSPAFLGNAEQSSQWRTPPFKAQLRQWWRMAYAAEHGFAPNVDTMRRDERHLFGSAGDAGHGDAAGKSAIRLRLARWDGGQLNTWPKGQPQKHPEVKVQVDSFLYLGYGPIGPPRGANAPTLKAGTAIQAGDTAALSLAVPEQDAPRVERALLLMSEFGTVGGRSRNGWGSYSLSPIPKSGDALPLRPWTDALRLDWPHALGRDDRGPLIWQTVAKPDWKDVMNELARVKIGLRTRFRFPNIQPDGMVHPRHWLSYPVTNHSVGEWKNLRLPNSLRFKVRPTAQGRLAGIIFHVPCLPPPSFQPDVSAIRSVWRDVHDFLDRSLSRIPA